jgi:hypothetical protein
MLSQMKACPSFAGGSITANRTACLVAEITVGDDDPNRMDNATWEVEANRDTFERSVVSQVWL